MSEQQGTFMSVEEMNAELIDCARYGEAEDLRNFLAAGADVNSTDATGSTALHKASANGELECLVILKEYNAAYTANDGGNFPSHWAAQNGKLEALKFLVESYPEVNMLTKNGQGRSTLTDAFTRGDESVLEVCLSHDSASEEELMRTQTGPPPADGSAAPNTVFRSTDGDNGDDAAAANAILHTMNLGGDGSSPLLKVRELPITRADNPFGSDIAPEDDTTGLALWPATVICARVVAQQRELLEGKVVVELGAGCGLPGLAAAMYCNPKSVYITDIHEPTIRNSVHNIHINERTPPSGGDSMSDSTAYLGPDGTVKTVVKNVSWTDVSTYPDEKADVLLGSDLVYDANILSVLCPAVKGMLKEGGVFLYVAPDEGRDGMVGLINALAQCGVDCVSQTPCSEEMYANPLAKLSKAAASAPEEGEGEDMDRDGDDRVDTGDHFVLHFYDLARKQAHSVYRFENNSGRFAGGVGASAGAGAAGQAASG